MILFGYRLPGMSSLLVWGLLWEIVGRADLTFFVPPLSEVLSTLFSIIGTPAFQKALAETAYAFTVGVVFAIVIGITVGILMGKNRLLDELLLPWVNVFLSAPLTALVPVLMVLFGWMSLVGVVRAEFLRARNLEYVRAARALGVSNITIMRCAERTSVTSPNPRVGWEMTSPN